MSSDDELKGIWATLENTLKEKAEKTQARQKKSAELKKISRVQRELSTAYTKKMKVKEEAEEVANMVAKFKDKKKEGADLAEKILLPQLASIFMQFCEEHKTTLDGVSIVLNCSKTNDSPHFNIVVKNNPLSRVFHKTSIERIAADFDDFASEIEDENNQEGISPD